MDNRETLQPAGRRKPKLNYYPFWAPRFWHGMRLTDWLRVVLPKWHRVHPLRYPMALIVTCIAVFNSLLFRVQRRWYGQQVATTPISEPPVFIIGHWRSGTTFLHELMVCDERFSFPTTFECFAPNHFLITSRTLPTLLRPFLPRKRPMDNMPAGFEYPQEDEFALCSLGAPTPYLRMAFPNDPPPYCEFLDMEQVAPRDLARWKEKLLYFTQSLTFLKGKQLLLKSPPHTGRIQVLRELFPGARFVHIVRDPYAIFPSTQRLWYALDSVQGLQFPKHEGLDEFVFSAFERMYQGFRKQSVGLGPKELCEVRYEDLIADPIGEMERIYEQLGLGSLDAFREKLVAFTQQRQDHVTNRHELAPELKAEIRRRWSWYFETYGYAEKPGRLRTQMRTRTDGKRAAS